jgi:hypothetical protein
MSLWLFYFGERCFGKGNKSLFDLMITSKRKALNASV